MTNLATKKNTFQSLGSYKPEDCIFLLKEIDPVYETVENKERLIQNGVMHYSEMVNRESAPSQVYLDLFYAMMALYKTRLASEIMCLAQLIKEERGQNITLVSLARAGTPIGALLNRALNGYLGCTSVHYSISIIRDRGIDSNALQSILNSGHADASIVFVDGWTAKGVITHELHTAVKAFNQQFKVAIPAKLYVISDIGGTADVQATFDDYTIPSALLNATVSGLVSRSILNTQIHAHDYHGAVVYEHLREHDRSNWFLDHISGEFSLENKAPRINESKQERQAITKAYLDSLSTKYQVGDINRIKPGIAEATRVMLRRVPDLLIVREIGHQDTLHLEQLANEKGVAVVCDPAMPFGACSLIKDVSKE